MQKEVAKRTFVSSARTVLPTRMVVPGLSHSELTGHMAMNHQFARRPAFDIAIVGAGPAGCAAAISAAQANFRTVLIEGSGFPRFRPGESLHPGIQPLMGQLGCEKEFLAVGFPRFAGIHVRWGSEPRFHEFGNDGDGPWLGFQAWRETFDQILLHRARQLGVAIIQPCRALRPLLSEQRVVGVDTSVGAIESKFVIDAAGGRHWLAKALGIPIHEYSPRLIARYGYCDRSPYPGELPAIVAHESGWSWYAEVARARFHWTRLSFTSEANDPSTVAGNSQRGADVTWRIVARPSDPGYFTVGDAAAVLDPASSHGVLRAIMSGMMAADVIRQISECPHAQAELARNYCKWWTSWFEHDVHRLHDLYRQHSSWPQWCERLNGMNKLHLYSVAK